jgi:RHS repeat-associated protein
MTVAFHSAITHTNTNKIVRESYYNITHKSDVGSCAYGDPLHAHAVTSIGTMPGQFTYDANGNQLTGMGRANTWTAANKLRQIIQNNGRTTTFAFDADRQCIIQQESGGSDGTIKTIYVSPIYEKMMSGTLIEERHYIMTPLGRTAMRTVRDDNIVETRYYHADGHGTIHAVTDEEGNVEQSFYYDPWGKQTIVCNNRVDAGGRQTRGYTDHEMLTDYNLIHMNARLYDPIIARFISADRVVQDMGDSQTYNRYSYCANNPVNTTDPTGNSFTQWLYFGLDTEEIQELLAEAYSQAREKLREKLTPGASPAPKAGATASADGNDNAGRYSLLNQGPDASAQAGKQSQSNGNNENSNGTAPSSASNPYADPNPSYKKGVLTFTTTLMAKYAGRNESVPKPLGGGTTTMGSKIAGCFVVSPVTVSVTISRSSLNSISATVDSLSVTLPTFVYYNNEHFSFENGDPTLQTQYAENQHAIDYWAGRDNTIIPMLERRLNEPFVGTKESIERELTFQIMRELRVTNKATHDRYDYERGPHNGGTLNIPSNYPGFAR